MISMQVVAEVQGNLMGAKGFMDFSYKYLLIPSVTHWTNSTLPVQYTVSVLRKGVSHIDHLYTV